MEKCNVNLCSKEELMRLPGVGEETARAIIDYREQHGPFKSLDDLANVRNIEKEQIKKLRSKLVV